MVLERKLKKRILYDVELGPPPELSDEEAKKEILKRLPIKFININTYKEMDSYFHKNLFISGLSGTGKTVFVCSLAKVYIKKNYKVKFINYPKFIIDIQKRFDGRYYQKDSFGGISEESAYDFIDKSARYPGYLIIDDLGAEKLTDFVRQTTYYLINEREMNELPLIITSNYGLGKLAEQIDDRIASRIAGMCEIVKFGGEDRRIKE